MRQIYTPPFGRKHQKAGLAGMLNKNRTIIITAVASSTCASSMKCAQPGTKPGSRKNHSITQMMNRTRTAPSWNDIRPRSLNFWRIIFFTSFSRSASVLCTQNTTQTITSVFFNVISQIMCIAIGYYIIPFVAESDEQKLYP